MNRQNRELARLEILELEAQLEEVETQEEKDAINMMIANLEYDIEYA